jgi:hypothetical protein
MSWRVDVDQLPPWAVSECLRITTGLLHNQEDRAGELIVREGPATGMLWDAIRGHNLVEFVSGRLPFSRSTAYPPVQVPQRVAEWLDQQRHRRGKLMTTFELLANLLQRAGIEFIVLKGMPFALRYYGKCELRATRDLDLLVRREDVWRTLRAIEPHGFVPKKDRRNPFSAQRLRTDHAASLYGDDVEVDLHWQLRNRGIYRIDEDALWDSTREFILGAIPIRILSAEYELLLMLLSLGHDIERGACRIKHLLDTYLILRSLHETTDWEQFCADRAEDGTLSECLNVIDLVLTLLAVPGEFPRLQPALDARRDQLVGADFDEALSLIRGPRGNMANQLWFAAFSSPWNWRTLARTLDRNVTRPGRIPWLLIKGIRRLSALASHRRKVG